MKQRIISAIVVLAIIIPLIILGGTIFEIAVSIIGILAMKEILNLKQDIPKSIKILTYILVGLLIFVDVQLIDKIFFIIFIYYLLLIFYDNKLYNLETCNFIIGSMILLTLVFSQIYLIWEFDINVFIYLILISTLTDTFAYIGGKLFGKHKLIEKISPNKTIEGSIIGSLIGTILPAAFYVYMINPGEYLIIAFLFTLTLSIIGQIGDLIFSSIKRYYNVKDYSNIIPGHGGILDRLDSIIFIIIGYIILVNFM